MTSDKTSKKAGLTAFIFAKLDSMPFALRKWLVGFLGVVLFGGTIALLFLYFYLSSRLSYPERGVVYRANETVTNYASGSQKYHMDRSSIASISEGTLLSGKEEDEFNKASAVKVKAIMCTSKRREKGDVDEYELLNTVYQKVAQASTKSERSRAVFDISRSNYIENVAGFVSPAASTEDIKLITLEQAKEITRFVDADTYVLDEKTQKPILKYRLTDGRRYFGIFGDQFRTSTKLSEPLSQDVFKTIYHSQEDGLFGLMPQGSDYYFLRDAPGFFEKWSDYFAGKKDTSEASFFKVTQSWDFLPWRTLNGGYKISDFKGDIAKIRIEDFWFNYDEDVVYWYYLDLNGNGVIEDSTEVVGRVLFSKNAAREQSADAGQKDVSYTVNYSYMAGSSVRTAARDFVLCGDIEAMMPDQVFDGYGQHSYLGFIEEKRDDIMLYLDRSIENLDRAIKEDDTLGTKTSIIRLLVAAKRPYAASIAIKLGVSVPDIK
ncbi:MAG TPA: hypothetical protein PKK26_15700 [Candidatus Wallbacteria bacterium]|nr:hypothetical protein [Candidatus Wallbacteria bacterium]